MLVSRWSTDGGQWRAMREDCIALRPYMRFLHRPRCTWHVPRGIMWAFLTLAPNLPYGAVEGAGAIAPQVRMPGWDRVRPSRP